MGLQRTLACHARLVAATTQTTARTKHWSAARRKTLPAAHAASAALVRWRARSAVLMASSLRTGSALRVMSNLFSRVQRASFEEARAEAALRRITVLLAMLGVQRANLCLPHAAVHSTLFACFAAPAVGLKINWCRAMLLTIRCV
jgi:hypothetical protein